LVEKRQNIWGKKILVSSLFVIGELIEASAGHSERGCMRKSVRLGTNYLRSDEFNTLNDAICFK
jgi:hypothetical protein